MTIINPQQLVDEYVAWLRNRITFETIGSAIEITTPFLDRNNDRIQIYVVPHGNGIRLTDEGSTISDLELSGCAIDTPRRRSMLETILNGFGVQEQDGKLIVDATLGTIAPKKHALLQAILAVNDMFMTAQKHVVSLFFEDVQKYLDEYSVRYIRKPGFVGRTGFTQTFDFVIPPSQVGPERLVSTVNDLTKSVVAAHLFAWDDTQKVRDVNAQYYIILNDSGRDVDSTLVAALENYKVRPVLWSARAEVIKELAA